MHSLEQVIYFLEQRQQTEDWDIRGEAIVYLKGYLEVLPEYAKMKADAVTKKEPLTWHQLCNMIDQPVWSMEKRRHYLVTDAALMHDDWLEIVDSDGKIHHLIEHDLKDYKLFREKRMTEE